MPDRSLTASPSDRAGLPAARTTRRSLVKGMAWATPAMLVSTAAPAINASLLTCVTLDWATFPTGLIPGGRLTDGGSTSVGGVSVTLRHASGRRYHSESFTVDRGMLRLRSNINLIGSAAGTLQTLTLEFDADVRNVSLRVYDFDWDDYRSLGAKQSFRDQVYIPQGALRPDDVIRGPHVTGAGTPDDPFTGSDRAKGNKSGAPGQADEALHCVDLVWRGPVRAISLAYVQATEEGMEPTPTIWISNVDFCV